MKKLILFLALALTSGWLSAQIRLKLFRISSSESGQAAGRNQCPALPPAADAADIGVAAATKKALKARDEAAAMNSFAVFDPLAVLVKTLIKISPWPVKMIPAS